MNKIEGIEDIEQTTPTVGNLGDRMVVIEKKLEENVKLKAQVEDLLESRLWEEYERKRDNPILHGQPGKQSPQESISVVKNFMVEHMKINKEWVEDLQIKSAMELQGTGDGPVPLRMSFMYTQDTELCLQAGPGLKGTVVFLGSDLPKAVRVVRAILASKGYLMKQNGEDFSTQIREKAINVWLEVKYIEKGEWTTTLQ